jgi:hypothetical protein
MAILYKKEEELKLNYIYCPNCFRRLPLDSASYEKINTFAMLYPRTGEGVDSVSQCYRILGSMKNVIIHPSKNRMEFDLNATPSLPTSDGLLYKVILESVPGINNGMDRGGDVVAKIVSKTMNTCKSEYYDFYFFGTWKDVPHVVWADSYMEMSALRWEHAKLMIR